VIKIRYRDPQELSPGLHAAAERHGRTTTVYLIPGLTPAQRRSALRRLRMSARRGQAPKLPTPQLAVALLADRVRTTVGQAGAVFRSHPAGSTVPVMVVSAGAIAFLALSAVSIQVIHPARNPGRSSLAGAAASGIPLNAGPGPGGTSPGGAPAAQGGSGGGQAPGQQAAGLLPGAGLPGGTGSGGTAAARTGHGSGAGSGASQGSNGGTTLSGGAAPSPSPAGSGTASATGSPSAAASPAAATASASPTAAASKSSACLNVGPLGICL
jgi:hypothetical protein